jgi:hypothetical protein
MAVEDAKPPMRVRCRVRRPGDTASITHDFPTQREQAGRGGVALRATHEQLEETGQSA